MGRGRRQPARGWELLRLRRHDSAAGQQTDRHENCSDAHVHLLNDLGRGRLIRRAAEGQVRPADFALSCFARLRIGCRPRGGCYPPSPPLHGKDAARCRVSHSPRLRSALRARRVRRPDTGREAARVQAAMASARKSLDSQMPVEAVTALEKGSRQRERQQRLPRAPSRSVHRGTIPARKDPDHRPGTPRPDAAQGHTPWRSAQARRRAEASTRGARNDPGAGTRPSLVVPVVAR